MYCNQHGAAGEIIVEITCILLCVYYSSNICEPFHHYQLPSQGSAADICGCARPPPLCTLCEFGIPPSKPDDEIPARMVGNTEPMTCSDFDKLTHSPFTPSLFLENSAKCSAVRSVGKMYCGCQEPCSFCGKGYRIANPTHPVRDMQNLLDSIVGPFAEDDGPPTCRDVSNAAATALVLFSASSDLASPLDYGIDMETAKGVNEEYICELYRSAFASECNCVKVSTPEKGCNICDNDAFEDPNQSVQVMVDGISVGTTCANVDAFALLGLDVCSEITERHCPCNEAFPATSSSIIADTAPSDEHSSNAETQFDAVGVSLAVSTVIVIVASIL